MTLVKRVLGENWLTLLIVAVMAIAFVVLKSSPSDIADEQAFWAELESANTAVVYFYSNT